ncbi:molybdopterin-binding protein [Streptomyces sp. NPDC091292]|uniref:TOBE domain-containing protein n=1 Tax=Streptomyces sp. NPDC091292 TaxID=3365991 RepID=UPI0038050058
MTTYSIGQAARLLDVSPETVRRWADAGRLRVERDASGTRVIDGVSLAAHARSRADSAPRVPDPAAARTSVRNAFTGIVTAVTTDDVIAQVEVQAGPHRIVSVVTRDAVEELGLRVGVRVTARVKSTHVYVDRPTSKP